MNKKQWAVINAARAYQRAALNCDMAGVLEDSGEFVLRSSNSWYEEVERAQRALFEALEAIDGPFVYEVAAEGS